MRLINTATFKLGEFAPDRIPPYAILSHTWAEEEVTFAGYDTPGARQGLGWAKTELSCDQALHDGLEYVWVDTCCIDKIQQRRPFRGNKLNV